MTEKQLIRREIAAAIAALPPEDRIVMDAHIATQITHAPFWDEARIVAGYVAMADEVDLQAVFRAARQAGKEVALPRVEESDTGHGSMTFRRVAEFPPLLEGHRLGMLQPPADTPILNDFSSVMLLVPGRAFDRRGHRIGRGGGYYDTFLSSLPPVLISIGVGYAVQLLPTVPAEAHDHSVQLVITDTETCFASRPGKT